ncbi:hypothetical protein [Paraliobacillus sp. JSM ZJ581]|uniref:hypothetical protein n=1 Tax=Paraliobacillus sp. JSM ZJ581 TaxID=3342118 RepID=UPI0035A86305
MKKSKTFKILLGLFIITLLLIPIATSASSANYSFKISARVDGSTSHSLANKSTSTTARGQTYYSSGSVNPTSSYYYPELDGGWFRVYSTGDIKANGYYYTKSFGTIKKDNYTINVIKSKKGSYGEYIQGSGSIKQ